MRFSIIASAAALAPTLASASNADLKATLGTARVYNKCDKPVYLWSVKKDQGCEKSKMVKLEPGASPYSEQYRDDGDDVGVSIKISWTEQCKGPDITQLEYFINHAPGFDYNYLDVSFVDCLGGKCPGRDKFCLKSGNNGDARLATAGLDKAICPVLKCKSMEECASMAYILPDDVQTKTCEPAADMDFYLCSDSHEEGADEEPQEEKPQEEKPEEEEPESPSQPTEEKPAAPTSVAELPSKVEDVSASEITPAPEEQPKEPKVKTEVVYVTEYAYVNEKKRHAHGHRHKHFRA